MKRQIYHQIIIITILTILNLTSPLCELPQKSAYFSFQSLANKDQLTNLFKQIPHSSFNLQYKQSKLTYSINLQYELLYNNHYQKQKFLDKTTINVILGPINIISRFNYSIKNNDSSVVEKGIAYGRSNLDYTSFQKKIIFLEGYLQWDPIFIEKITFSSLWVIQGVSYQMSEDNRFIFQKIMNNQLGNNTLNKKIEKQINEIYPSKLKLYLNQQKLLSLSDIPYKYNNIQLNITHNLIQVNIIPEKGIEAYFKFGLNSSKQTNCSKLPSFDQSQFGGIQQIITFSSIKTIIMTSLQKGLYNVIIDKSWQVQMFQLFMGDLANAVSYADNLAANSPIFISCSTLNPSNSTIIAFDQSSIYIELAESCTIKSSQAQLIKFQMQLISIATIEAQTNYLSVKINKFQTKGLKFSSIDSKFIVDNLQIAKIIVNNVLNGLIGKQCFGSKFPILQRKYPSIFLRGQYLVIFDHSEVYI